MKRLSLKALCLLVGLCALEQSGAQISASTTIYLIPVYEWTLVWKEWRNDNYIYGSIWRPKMIAEYDANNFPGQKNIEVDGYDVSQYFSDKAEPVFLGDVFTKGHEPPNFVGVVLVIDIEPTTDCPNGVPCFQRESTSRFQNLLVVTPDRNLFETVWESHLRQCREQTDIQVPLLCAGEVKAAGNCEDEPGYAQGEIPIRFMRPTCPSDFYVMGHIGLKGNNGTIPDEEPMTSYKCIHESLLRKGTFVTDSPIFSGRGAGTSVWNKLLIVPEYYSELSLWSANCQQEGCGELHCIDTIGEGLFYAHSSESTFNLQITGAQSTAPETGPKCLALYRDCTTLQADGSLITNTGDSTGLLESDCDSELGKEGTPLSALQGLYMVTPSGLPSVAEVPTEIELRVVDRICARITEENPVNLEGDVRINGILATWVSMIRTSGTLCTINVNVRLDGSIKPGPARIAIRAVSGSGALLDILSEGGTGATARQQRIGQSIGRLTIYNEPSVNASLIEPRVINSFFCELRTIVKFPQESLVRQYYPGAGSFLCEWRNIDQPDIWYVGEEPSVIDSVAEGYRGIKCFIPQRTAPIIILKVSINGGINYHTIEEQLVRLGDPDSAIASDGALRVFDVVPRAGPETGGTLVTVHGQFFELYCNQTAISMGLSQHCNKMTCTFIFSIGGGTTQKSVGATVVDDKRLTCITPQAVPQVSLAQLEISADYNPPCSTVADDPLKYNQVDFLYQTAGTAAEIPASCCTSDPAQTPHRLQGNWFKCTNVETNATGYTDCREFPGIWDNVAELGYISCLGGFNQFESNETNSAKYPAWCFRALPMNSGADYQITFTDPFFKAVTFLLRKIPLSYPGYCHVTNHHLPWERISTQLDYRLFDLYDRGYRPGDPIPPESKRTQGKNLIDRLFSTSALSASNGVSYMRSVMHELGHKYGFIDLGLSFNLEIDFTMASRYDEVNYRRSTACAKPNPTHGFYSGFIGDEGPGGSYVDWNKQYWEPGKPACAPNNLWPDECERTILKSPNHEDDVGVMLTAPAKVEITAEAEDFVVGCGRMRVVFNCSSFSLDDCIRNEIIRDTPNAQYRNFGSKTRFVNWENWCDFNYPEEAGPNNAQSGWTGTSPPSGYQDYRYWYRHSPCVRCRQAKEICDALFINSARLPIVDNVPTGSEPVDLGDKSSTFEIPLGCFGDPQYGGGVEDQCCLDAGDQSTARPFLGKCTTTLQRCVRAGTDFRCARMNEGDSTDEDCAYNANTQEVPLCAPLNLV